MDELTEEERIKSYMNTRLKSIMGDFREFSKRELAEFCLKEIDYALEVCETVDVEDLKDLGEE